MADDQITHEDLKSAVNEAVADVANTVGDAVGKSVSSKISGKFKVVEVQMKNVDEELKRSRANSKELYARTERNANTITALDGIVKANKKDVEGKVQANKEAAEGAVAQTNEKISTSRWWIGILLGVLMLAVGLLSAVVVLAK